MKKFLLTLLCASALEGCAGYHIGPVKPHYLSAIKTIAIPTFSNNNTYLPRTEVLVTNTVIKQLQQDGTYTITSGDKADAILKGEIRGVTRAPVRALSGNVLATTEFNLALVVRYTLTGRDGKVIAGPIDVAGSTSFFVSTDIAADQRQALPLAAEDLAVRLASQLSEGW